MCARGSPPRSTHVLDSWGARVVLIAVIVATTVYAARANNNGVDFANNVWGPARGLLSGRNPYEPANSSYLRRYDLSLVGGLYTPSVLVLHLPLVALSKSRASDVIAVLDALLVWAGVLLLVRPRSAAGYVVATLLGALLVASAPVQDSVAFGQIAPWAFFGFALLVRTIDAPVSPWWPALGVVLISLKPQSMVPMFVVLALLAAWGLMSRALALLVATSLPGLALLLHAAGSPAVVGHTVRDNLRYFAHVPEDDLRDAVNNRVDLSGVLAHLHGPVLAGFGWDLAVFVTATIVLALLLAVSHAPRTPAALTDPFVLTLATAFVVVTIYHQPYDQLLLFVGPLAAVGAAFRDRYLNAENTALLAVAAVLLLVELGLRTGFRTRMVDLGWSAPVVRAIYFSAPTVLAIVMVAGCAIARRVVSDPRTST